MRFDSAEVQHLGISPIRGLSNPAARSQEGIRPMTADATHDALVAFALSARLDRRANASVAGDGSGLELLLAPKFHALLETILAARSASPPRVLPEYRRAGIGRPDLAFARQSQLAHAYIELKQPDASLTPNRLRGHDKDQHARFRELPLWGFCNFHTIDLYKRDKVVGSATILPAAALDQATSDQRAERMIRSADPGPFLDVLDQLALSHPASPRTAAEIAELLAHAARLTQHIVLDQCRVGPSAMLSAVRAEFRETLFAHAAAGGYDTSDENVLFANAFAQTLAFGLLLAREATGHDVDRDSYRRLSDGIYPLLRATLRALTQDEVLDDLGVAFDVMLDTVNAIDVSLLKSRDSADPILYFYEDFLAVFDEKARKRHGVFFTPVPVVRYMVAATDRALRDTLGTQGLMDPDVLVLDPACGTGTFLIAAANHVARQVRDTMGEGAVAQEIAALATRLYGFELLVGPYTVAHYRLLREIASYDVVPTTRLPIYLTDTLSPPAGERHVVSPLGFMAAPILAEREAADEVKSKKAILAVLGNPPYRRLGEGEEAALVSGWADGFWDDLKAPVRNAGWGGELNTFPDLYIAFWRWSLWKLFESDGAPKRGIVCLITNRTFLAGHPYAGLRQMMRQRFEWIDIIDLRGDSRGARPAGVKSDENIFAIQTGVCILLAKVAEAERRPAGVEAHVRYADAWRHGAFSARDKLAMLADAEQNETALTFVDIERSGLDDFVPAAFGGLGWPSISAIFLFRKSGSKSQRDPLVYGLSSLAVQEKIQAFLTADENAAREVYFAGEKPTSAEQTRFARARDEAYDNDSLKLYVYRPFDRRFLYASRSFVSRRGPDLVAAWGTANIALYALPSGTGAGPAVWVHGLLPDYHAFSGRGGYAFPLFNRAAGPEAHNLQPRLLAHLTEAHGQSVTPQKIFDVVTALLSASSYTSQFAWDLEEAFPHVPFPHSDAAFCGLAAIGTEIRLLETFARIPAEAFRHARLTGRAAGATLDVPPIGRAWRETKDGRGDIRLQADGPRMLSNVSDRAWQFEVSGYRVLYRWLHARNGEALDAALQRTILDLAWRIEELLHWFDAADPLLAEALARPMAAGELGLEPTLGNEPE
jgi:SAM-dependent methyltransferase